MGKKQDAIKKAADAAQAKVFELCLSYVRNVVSQSPYKRWGGRRKGRRDFLLTFPSGFRVSIEVKSVGPIGGTAFDKIKSFAHDVMEQHEMIDSKPEYKHQLVDVSLCVCVPSGPIVSPYATDKIEACKDVLRRRQYIPGRVLMLDELKVHLVNNTLVNILNKPQE